MKIAFEFQISAEAQENQTTIKVLDALTGVMKGGVTEAPATAKTVKESSKPAPEALKEEVQKVAPVTDKSKPVTDKPAKVADKPAPSKKAMTVEEMQNAILVIAQRYGKKGKTEAVKKLRSAVSGAQRISDVTDPETLALTLD